jgi:hypothetical protein
MQTCNNDQMEFFMYNVLLKFINPFQFCWRLILQNNKMPNMDFKDNIIYKYTSFIIIWSLFFVLNFIFLSCFIFSCILFLYFDKYVCFKYLYISFLFWKMNTHVT